MKTSEKIDYLTTVPVIMTLYYVQQSAQHYFDKLKMKVSFQLKQTICVSE